jgi:hypothetical protein
MDFIHLIRFLSPYFLVILIPAMTQSEPVKRLTPTPDTIRELYLKSGNQCAFPGCTHVMIENGSMLGQICHIEAAEEGGQRFNAMQTNEERRHLSNLLLLCYDHHVITNNVSEYRPERMKGIKLEHEAKFTDLDAILTSAFEQSQPAAKVILNAITGGDSYPYIFLSHGPGYPDIVGVVMCKGENTLTNLDIFFVDESGDKNTPTSDFLQVDFVHHQRSNGAIAFPIPPGSRKRTLRIETIASNGEFVQTTTLELLSFIDMAASPEQAKFTSVFEKVIKKENNGVERVIYEMDTSNSALSVP